MANIYQLSQELLAIFDIIEENEGELTPEIEEALTLTQESFKDKIKSYVDVIKYLQTDIKSIKEEKDRLNALQKSKEKTIERITKVVLKAIDEFGDVSKSGSKFIDYGTGKVSIRMSETVDIDTDITERFVNRLVAGFNWYDIQGQLNMSCIESEDLLDYANSPTTTEVEDDIEITKLSAQDLDDIDADINLNISLNQLLGSEKGFDVIKALTKYGSFTVKPKIDKTAIKQSIKTTNKVPVFAKLTRKQNLTIK